MVLTKRHYAASNYAKVVAIRSFVQELDDLYARRTAIEALIESLEQYNEFRVKPMEPSSCRTA